jgi:hypothetical protein
VTGTVVVRDEMSSRLYDHAPVPVRANGILDGRDDVGVRKAE